MTIDTQKESYKRITEDDVLDIWMNNLIQDILTRNNQHVNDKLSEIISKRPSPGCRYSLLAYRDSPNLGSGWQQQGPYYTGPILNYDRLSDINLSKKYKIEKEGHLLNGWYITLEHQHRSFDFCWFWWFGYCSSEWLIVWLNTPNLS